MTDTARKPAGLGRAILSGALAAIIAAVVLVGGWILLRRFAGAVYGGDGTVRASKGPMVVDLGPVDFLHEHVQLFHLKRLSVPVALSFEVAPKRAGKPYSLPNPIIHLLITTAEGRVMVDSRGMLREWTWEQHQEHPGGPIIMVARRDSSGGPPTGVVDQLERGGGGTHFRPSLLTTYQLRLEVIMGDQNAATSETRLLLEQD